ncbi:hypothetical protein D3C76_574280 [compost metagenome]
MDLNQALAWVSANANTIAATAGAFSAIAGLLSAQAAFRAIKRNDHNHSLTLANAERTRQEEELSTRTRIENERLLQYAITTIERAYLALRGRDPDAHVPPQNRLNWLTAARLIEEYRVAKNEISDPQLVRECESHEEHWRHQVYLLLLPLADGYPDYFYADGTSGAPIQSVSAVIVHSFADWPEGKVDPLLAYRSIHDAVRRYPVHMTWFNLRNNLRDF